MKKQILILMSLMLSMLVFGGLVSAIEQHGLSGTPINQASSASVTVQGWMSITLDNLAITFPSLNPGEGSFQNPPSLSITVNAVTNVPVKVEVKGETEYFSPNADAIKLPVSGLLFTSQKNGGAAYGSQAYSHTVQKSVCDSVTVPLVAGNLCTMNHQLSIPDGLKSGTYTEGITITATGV